MVFAISKVFTLRFDRGDRDFLKFRTIIPSSGIALDVGSNVGVMTVLLAAGISEHGQVISFEPMPTNFYSLADYHQAFLPQERHVASLGAQ